MKILVICCLFLSLISSAQSVEEDSAAYRATFDWLERKLTYNYYDPTNEHWWVNRFQENDNGSVNIKNIAAKHPDKVLEKVYYNRTLQLYDLNPRSISVIDLPTGQGRFVKGKIVRVEGFGSETKIKNIKDGKVGSDLNFIHVSIPDFLEDSLENYAVEVKQKFALAATLGARHTNGGNLEDNLTKTFETLSGNYISADSTATLSFDKKEPRLVRFELKDGDKYTYGTIGYDKKLKGIYILRSSSDDYYLEVFTFDETTRNLALKSGNDEVFLEGKNKFVVKLKGWSDTFFRY